MNIRYVVSLSESERTELQALGTTGKVSARRLKRAQILLAADAGRLDKDIAAIVGIGTSTVYRTKLSFVVDGLETALGEAPRPGRARKLSAGDEALLVATACSMPPEGRARWTLELLAGQMVRLTEHEEISSETIRRRLLENELKPWRKVMWCIPKIDAEYVARMENVLDLCAETPDPLRPTVCFDESPAQLIGEAREPIPAKPGQFERFDYEYRRNGTANLSSHSAGALYEAFPPEDARRILNKLEFHFTPKHASWLNMVEIEIGVLRGQCLDRRIGDRDKLEAEVAAWERKRNEAGARIEWGFTTTKAREKLKRAYPVVSLARPKPRKKKATKATAKTT